MLVVDAGVALYAATSAGGFERLAPHDPVAPPLMWSEALSVLHAGLWRDVTSVELATSARARLLASPVARRVPDDLYVEAWQVADELGWARTYDAEYVALARLLGCRLITTDERLRRGASRVVDIIGPDDL